MRSRRSFAPSDAPIDTLLLGCTHYPLLRPIIAALAGPQVAIVDSATATASALAELLDINGLRSRDQWATTDGYGGSDGASRPRRRPRIAS